MCSEWVMCYYLNTKRIEHIFNDNECESEGYAKSEIFTYSPLPPN
jgi:hypothetical protein